MDALVEIQLPTQPIHFYFFIIIIIIKRKSKANVMTFLCSLNVLVRKNCLLSEIHIVLLIGLLK